MPAASTQSASVFLHSIGQRWPTAVRAALSVGLPVAAGVWAGDPTAGLMATLGSFTSLYGAERPYGDRARFLAIIAFGFACMVTAGIASQRWHELTIPFVVLLSVSMAYVCSALRVGPPGAYMFVLAGAAATAMPAGHLHLLTIFGLVLGGGTISWLVHMVGSLWNSKDPERRSVGTAAREVRAFIGVADDAAIWRARHRAALALHDGWVALVNRQPGSASGDASIVQLRALLAQTHTLFAEAVLQPEPSDGRIRTSDMAMQAEIAEQIAMRASSADDSLQSAVTEAVASAAFTTLPIGDARRWQRLTRAARHGTSAWSVGWRVGVAAACSALIGATFGMTRVYWITAAAVLVLHQGLSWTGSMRRGVARTLGTLGGLVLSAALLRWQPGGIVLVGTMMAMQCIVELLVTYNYALAVVFVTALALTIASGGHALVDPLPLLTARGIDTAAGCAIGCLVHFVSTVRHRRRAPPADALQDVYDALMYLERGDRVSQHVLAARERLQAVLFESVDAFESRSLFASNEQMLPDRKLLEAMQRLGYVTLSLFWLQGNVRFPAKKLGPTLAALRQLRVRLPELDERLLTSQIEMASRHLCDAIRVIG